MNSGLLIRGHIGPVARVPVGNQLTFYLRLGPGSASSTDVADGTCLRFFTPDLRQSAWHLAHSSTSGLRGLVIQACHRRRYTAGI